MRAKWQDWIEYPFSYDEIGEYVEREGEIISTFKTFFGGITFLIKRDDGVLQEIEAKKIQII